MYGAILGDMIGAPYEFDRSPKTKDFPLFGKKSKFTDDSVMTVAVAEALLDTLGQEEKVVKLAVIDAMRRWGRRYPLAGYGHRFRKWLIAVNPNPYGSYGNGSAMRVAAAGWLCDSLEETRRVARWTAEVTHNHPEGVKGAEATAGAIFLARQGADKAAIRRFISEDIGYDLSRSCDEIRPTYHHVESCQETVPEAITAFLEGEDFEDVVRTAVSFGGDCDTLTCIAASIAEAFYGVPDALIAECRARLSEDMLAVVDRFQAHLAPFHDSTLDGNEVIEEAIARFTTDPREETGRDVLAAIRARMLEDGHVIVPVEHVENGMILRTVAVADGVEYLAMFTSQEAFARGPQSSALSYFIDEILKNGIALDAPGFVVNPWHQPFAFSREMAEQILEGEAPDRVN